MKLTNFRIKEDDGLKTILLDNRLQITETEVSFPPKPIPQTNNIASASALHTRGCELTRLYLCLWGPVDTLPHIFRYLQSEIKDIDFRLTVTLPRNSGVIWFDLQFFGSTFRFLFEFCLPQLQTLG